MNIYAQRGDKVIFSHPNAGGWGDSEKCAKHLELGAEYTVQETEVDPWHTDVYLQEVPGVAFNSVMFDDL